MYKQSILVGNLFIVICLGIFAMMILWGRMGPFHHDSIFPLQRMASPNAHQMPFYKIFGHVHIAKTAGTSLNGELAAHFERVCGHKGYSYDIYKAIERYTKAGADVSAVKDVYGRTEPGHSRLRVPLPVMDEIGYEDCDWISTERPAEFWFQFGTWPFPLELHLPCRDPVEHLMSQCNHRGITFDCEQAMERQVESCLIGMNRFSSKLSNSSNIELRCYQSNLTFPMYIQYMEKRLQRRMIEKEYVFIPTNKDRIKGQECIWVGSQLQEAVRAYLVSRYDYYSFCESCIGSATELQLGK